MKPVSLVAVRRAAEFLACLSLIQSVPRAAPGDPLWTFRPPPELGIGGYSVAFGDDYNRDGHPDLIAGSGGTRVFLVSGVDGTLLRTIDGPVGSERLGYVVADAGDLNGDGTSDILAGDPGDYVWDPGRVLAFSGADGAQLLQITGRGGNFGRAVAGVGDMTGDGTPDLAVGAPDWLPPDQGPQGYAAVYSGADGTLIHEFLEGGQAGFAVSGIGDLTGDGTSELAIGAPYTGVGSIAGRGAVRVYAGGTWELLYTIFEKKQFRSFGFAIAPFEDVNHDGLVDFLVAAPYSRTWNSTGFVTVHSGADGRQLRRYGGKGPSFFGTVISSAGDMDGDGRADLLVGEDRILDICLVEVRSGRKVKRSLLLLDSVGCRPAYALAGGRDVNGDGTLDIVLGRGPIITAYSLR